jgi:hypothetical protein
LVVVLTIFGNACDDIIESTAGYGRNDCLIVENFDWLRTQPCYLVGCYCCESK